MSMNRMNLTKHAAEDRIERLTRIGMTVGWGQDIKTFPSDKNPGVTLHLTDTGVIKVIDDSCNTLVTAFVANVDNAVMMYEGQPPRWVIERIKKAQKKFKRG